MTYAIFHPKNKYIELTTQDISDAQNNLEDHLNRQSVAVFIVNNFSEIKTKCEDALIYYESKLSSPQCASHRVNFLSLIYLQMFNLFIQYFYLNLFCLREEIRYIQM